MSTVKIHVDPPDLLCEYLHGGQLRTALAEIASLTQAELSIVIDTKQTPPCDSGSADFREFPILYRGDKSGRVVVECADGDAAATRCAKAITALLEHMVDREIAVNDLAANLMETYEELNLLYNLLPEFVTKVNSEEIGEVLVAKTAATLGCRRVSLMVLDDRKEYYTVLAGRGLPPEAMNVQIPLANSVVSHALKDDGLLVVNDISERPDLAGLSRGEYEGTSFVVARVPLQARGEPLGFITATEREGAEEFTAHDLKLLEGLSSMGASALMNCRLHSAVNKQMMSTIHALASAVDAKDQYTHDHAGRVARLCVATAREMGITDSDTLREVQLAGLLHDIGKIGIPDAILTKPASLTPEEFTTIQEHVKIGARIVEHVPGLEGVSKAILHHHERYDGLGYPSGMSGQVIPIASALITVADAFDALTSDRPYRKAGSVEDALNELSRCRGTQLHPAVVDAFTKVIHRDMSRPNDGDTADGSILALEPALVVERNG